MKFCILFYLLNKLKAFISNCKEPILSNFQSEKNHNGFNSFLTFKYIFSFIIYISFFIISQQANSQSNPCGPEADELTTTPFDICAGDIVTLDQLNGSLSDETLGGTWTDSFGGVITSASKGGTYNYTITGDTCDDIIVTVLVTENPLPTITIVAAPQCSTDQQTYNVNVDVSPGIQISASVGTITDNTGGNWTIGSITAGINTILTVINENGCEQTLEVSAPDCSCQVIEAPISVGDQEECNRGQTLTAAATVSGQEEIVDWYDSPTGGNIVTPNLTGEGTATYYAETRNTVSNCTSSSRTAVTLTIKSLPFAPTTTNITHCVGDTATAITTAVVASGTLAWYSDPEATTPLIEPLIITDTAGMTTYYVTQTDLNNCESATAPIVITINSLPSVVVNGPLVMDCNNTYLTLDGTGSDTTGVTYSWTASEGGTLTGETNGITATGSTAGTYSLTLTETATGCTATNDVLINLACLTIEIEQTSGPTTLTEAGQFVTYSIEVINTGTIDINNIVLTETNPGTGEATLSAVIESANDDEVLEIGEIWKYTATYITTQIDIDYLETLIYKISVETDEVPGPIEGTETTPIEVPKFKAFEGAEGYGKYSKGGRGGTVYKVTNLNDSGPGSLREACEANGARVVIFDVGGRINLSSRINITNPYITIAGQHSVGDGITLSMEGIKDDSLLVIETYDVIIRYITFRRSEFEVSEVSADGLVIYNAHDVIIDHCSFSWASDENIAIYDYDGNANADTYNITIQNSLIDIGWRDGKGILCLGGVDRLSFYNLLFTSVFQRQPLISNNSVNYVTSDTYFEIINTITFEGKFHTSFPNNAPESGLKHLNYINNLCIDSDFSRNMLFVDTTYPVSIFAEGNISPLRTSVTSPVDWDEEWSVLQAGGGSGDIETPPTTDYRVTTPISTPIIDDGAPIIDAVNLWDNLKDHVGASYPTRDSEDARAINDVETQISTAPVNSATYPILSSGTPLTDSDDDGMPDVWEIANGFNPNVADDDSDADNNGYTNLEEFLNEVVNYQPVDTESPTKPTNLVSSNLTQTSFTLNWDVATDNVAVASYDIYEGVNLLGNVGNPTYNITGLTADTTYDFTVIAKDPTGNMSAASSIFQIKTLENSPSPCTTNPITQEYKINNSWQSGLDKITLNEGDNLILSILPNNVGVVITLPDGTEVGDDFRLGNVNISDSGIYTMESEFGCIATLEVTVVDPNGPPPCITNPIIQEYTINGNVASGSNQITLDEGDNLELSILPDGVGVVITLPDGTEVGDNYNIGSILLSQSGVYAMESEFGCIKTLDITVIDPNGPSPCTTNPITQEYKINNSWQSGLDKITLNEGDNLILSILPNNVDVVITLPDGTEVGDDFRLGNVNISDSGIYTMESEFGCIATLEVEVTIVNANLLNKATETLSLDMTEFQNLTFFKIIPNPAKEFVDIFTTKNSNIEIINILGVTLKTFNNTASRKTRVHLDGIPNGVYFVRNTNKDNSEIKRLVINY